MTDEAERLVIRNEAELDALHGTVDARPGDKEVDDIPILAALSRDRFDADAYDDALAPRVKATLY